GLAVPSETTELSGYTLLKQGNPSFYCLKLRSEYINKYRETVKCTFGEQISYRPKRTIMLLGATGSGKSTLINGMINYILGVQWDDDLRFKLIYEETCKSQAESQTSKITAYEMNHREGFQVDYSLTIIDTPGFGDTMGLNGFQQIDAVCFVVQASQARLTHAQKYIFDSILSIFGKDIANNILMLITFADGQRPPVLDAITASNIPCNTDDNGNPVYFKFNNSALFANNKESTCSDKIFDKMFWEMGTQSMKRFFDSLEQMNTKSLSLTKEVLEERKRLEMAIEGLQPQIRAGLTKLEEIRKTGEALKQHIDQIESNKNFEYEVEVTETLRESIAGTGKFITNCQKCNFTCHYPCAFSNDEEKISCAAMKNGDCTVCPGKCVWSVHSNQQYRFIYKTSKIQRTYDELKKNFEKATGEKMTTEKLFEQLQHEFDEVEDAVCALIHTSHDCITRLEEIALRPNPLSTPDYIDLLINNEKQEAKPGFMERIKSLEEVKQQAVIIQKVINKEELLPSEKLKYNCKEERKKQRGMLVSLVGAFSYNQLMF
uniref:Septin-type G domain-containing protein n=1 Tax=Erpetoichthys calabaricus TaxID=27687 RepID=A0A8C4RMD4_ERPCA